MGYPTNFRYTTDHEWVLIEGTLAMVGITDFAQSELGELVFVEFPKVGKTVKRGDAFCVVESTKAASDVYAPIAGTVREVNTALTGAPDTVNKTPHTSGWIAKLGNFDQAEIDGLMTAQQYEAHLAAKH